MDRRFMLARVTAALLLAASSLARADDPAGATSDVVGVPIGLFPGSDFRVASGRCSDCPAPRPALWYFEDDLVAVPRPGVPTTSHAAGKVQEDVAAWSRSYRDGDPVPRPALVWLGSRDVRSGVRLAGDGVSFTDPGGHLTPLTLAPRLSTNRSWYDETSRAFFTGRPLRLRGVASEDRFQARVLWPEDLRLESAAPAQPLAGRESMSTLVTGARAGADDAYTVRVLWERAGAARAWGSRPALGFVLNGAQGDDDEAHGGHFAIFTGTTGPQGEWADWLVNNFYNLDSVSEKGIVGAMVPMDAYLMDLNSGQSWYRPSDLLVLVLRDPRTAARYQGAVARVYEHYYRHGFTYHHSQANCTGISMDTLRTVGWEVPRMGPEGRLKATAGFFYIAAKDRSIKDGESTFDYLSQERTRLFPRAGFEAAGGDVLKLLAGQRRPKTDYERQLVEDVMAVVHVHVPQVPSSRAFGTWPIASLGEYGARVPADRSKWKIVPVPPRPFPVALREVPPPPPHRSKAIPVAGATAVTLVAAGLLGVRWARRRFGTPAA
jgi:hypothetical protein